MGGLSRGKDATEWHHNGGKEWVVGIKIRAFHSHATRQSLICCLEEVITKSGVLFRERGFIYGEACAERRAVGAVLHFPLQRLMLAIGTGKTEDAVGCGGVLRKAFCIAGHYKYQSNPLGNAGA